MQHHRLLRQHGRVSTFNNAKFFGGNVNINNHRPPGTRRVMTRGIHVHVFFPCVEGCPEGQNKKTEHQSVDEWVVHWLHTAWTTSRHTRLTAVNAQRTDHVLQLTSYCLQRTVITRKPSH